MQSMQSTSFLVLFDDDDSMLNRDALVHHFRKRDAVFENQQWWSKTNQDTKRKEDIIASCHVASVFGDSPFFARACAQAPDAKVAAEAAANQNSNVARCVVCKDQSPEWLFIWCGHVWLCLQCCMNSLLLHRDDLACAICCGESETTESIFAVDKLEQKAFCQM